MLLATSLLALAPLAALQDTPNTGQRKVPDVRVSFLANEGFLLQTDELSVVIDGFIPKAYSIYEGLPKELYQRLVKAEQPFQGTVLGLISHRHADHFQPRAAARFLKGNPQAGLFTSPQVVSEMKAFVKDPSVLERARSVPVEPGETQVLVHRGISIEMFPLPHGGSDNQTIQNYGHLITLAGIRFLHVGDVDVSREAFAPYDLASRSIDVAFIPYWFLGTDEGIEIIREQVGTARVIACHIPPAERETVIAQLAERLPAVQVFRKPMESFLIEGRSQKANRPDVDR